MTDKLAAAIAGRSLARAERRFADADRIRDELLAEGVILTDLADGRTEWQRDKRASGTYRPVIPRITIGCRCSKCYPPAEQKRLAEAEAALRATYPDLQ